MVVASFVSYTLILQALRTAPVSYVVATRQLSVVFAVGLALFWLRERPSRARIAGRAAHRRGRGDDRAGGRLTLYCSRSGTGSIR